MKWTISILSLLMLFCVSNAYAGFEGKNNGTSLKIFNKINCDTGITCTREGKADTFNIDMSGFQTQIESATGTSVTATSSQCGSTFINSGIATVNLPEASTVLGCRLTFVTGNASNYTVNPDDADQILVLTDSAGDAILNATLGNSVMLEATSASEWTQLSAIGTWTDVD